MGAFNFPAPHSAYLGINWNGQGIPPIDEPLSGFMAWWNLFGANPYSAGTSYMDMVGSAGGVPGSSPTYPGWEGIAAAAAGAVASMPSGGSGQSGYVKAGQTTPTTEEKKDDKAIIPGLSVTLPTGTWGGENSTPTITQGGSKVATPASGLDWSKLIPILGVGGAVAVMAALGVGGSKEVSPVAADPMFPNVQKSFGEWLASQFTKDEAGTTTGVKGATPYPGDVNFDISKTILPQVWGNWSPNNAGTDAISGMLPSLSQPNQQVQSMINSILAQGGTGGPITDNMNRMASTGYGTGAGSQALANIQQFGSPSPGGDALRAVSQWGVASEASGRPLANRAYGMPTAAQAYLQQFLMMPNGPYGAPGIQPQPVGRL